MGQIMFVRSCCVKLQNLRLGRNFGLGSVLRRDKRIGIDKNLGCKLWDKRG